MIYVYAIWLMVIVVLLLNHINFHVLTYYIGNNLVLMGYMIISINMLFSAKWKMRNREIALPIPLIALKIFGILGIAMISCDNISRIWGKYEWSLEFGPHVQMDTWLVKIFIIALSIHAIFVIVRFIIFSRHDEWIIISSILSNILLIYGIYYSAIKYNDYSDALRIWLWCIVILVAYAKDIWRFSCYLSLLMQNREDTDLHSINLNSNKTSIYDSSPTADNMSLACIPIFPINGESSNEFYMKANMEFHKCNYMT